MNSRAFTLSLVIAGVAVFMAYSYIDGMEAKLSANYGNPSPVVVASVDIGELDPIDDRKLTIINVPAKFKQPGAFSRVEELYNTIATVPIKKGEQITKPRVTYPGVKSGLSRQISVGKRAMSIRVTDETGIAQLVRPGDRVDLVAKLDLSGGQLEGMETRTVLQDVLVLATGFKVTNTLPMIGMKYDKEIRRLKLNEYQNFRTVTLELTPFQVQQLILLRETGSQIYLSLRNNDDQGIERVGASKVFDILGDDAGKYRKKLRDQARRPGGGGAL